MTTIKRPYLETCPFCGQAPAFTKWHGGGPAKRMVACDNDNCRVQPEVTGSTPQRAADNWNIRSNR